MKEFLIVIQAENADKLHDWLQGLVNDIRIHPLEYDSAAVDQVIRSSQAGIIEVTRTQ